jgi:hypothetical protein
MPVMTRFAGNSGQQFDELVQEYVREHRTNHIIH